MDLDLNWNWSKRERACFMCSELRNITEKAEVLLMELSGLVQAGPRFRIVHRFREPGTDCAPGEEIAAVYLLCRGGELHLSLSLALRLLFDYLAQNRRLPQNASQIAAGIRASPFYGQHGKNAGSSARQTRRISRSAIKEYIKRIRKALEEAFAEAALAMRAPRVLVSRETVGNEVNYCLKAQVEWVHITDMAASSSFQDER
jgi:hypothetical protein